MPCYDTRIQSPRIQSPHLHRSLPLLPTTPMLLPTTHHRRLRSITLLLLALCATQRRLLPDIHTHDILHTASVMLHSPHVRQPRPSDLPSRALYHLNGFHQRTVDFVPHFNTHAGQLAAEEDRSVDAAPPDVDAHAGEGITGSLTDEENIADTRAFGVVF